MAEDQNIPEEEIEDTPQEQEAADSSLAQTMTLSGLYENWFLDYASYVILERAVPDIRDGFKPVQRRILHAMKEMDDGRYNKVANIIGQSMKYHPHGDASIGDALVQLGQKDLLIDMQGNWGNILTGDRAAAPRYIEARLSKFALEVVFNPKTTVWLSSYDGRNREPEALPVKFPMLLAIGVEGIAVGLASKILPHNFNELLDASISYLRGRSFELYPDFATGGMADVSRYNDGLRGGKVRIRAKIEKLDKKTLVIREIPFSTTTSSLIDSIVSANDKGKIKIKKIEDNTAAEVEIVIRLGAGVSPDQTIDALYAFTNCEVSISPNSTVINGDKPAFLGMKEILKLSTDRTVGLLKLELEIHRAELLEQWHFVSLEKIFIRERLYRKIEESESFEESIDTIDEALNPYKKLFKREITRDDILRLTEIRIKRISKYNEFKADEQLASLEEQIAEVEHHLANLVDFAVDYFKRIKKKYGAGRERKTELRSFENINAAAVAVSNVKLYVNREEGFIGKSLKKDEFVTECSDIDDIIVFREDGSFVVTKVADKTFVGKNIIYVGVQKANNTRTIYNVIYRDGKVGKTYVKRFAVKGTTRDRTYDITKGTEGSKILYFSHNPNGEAEIVRVKLRPRPKLKKLNFDFDFSTLAIKGRGAGGNTLTKHMVSKITLKEDGLSTLGARDIWYDDTVRRLNGQERGRYLGAFAAEDKILTIMQSGHYRLNGFGLSTHFDEDMIRIEKFNPERIWTAIYFDGDSKYYYIKRFKFDATERKTLFITEHPKSKLIAITEDYLPRIELVFDPKKGPKNRETEVVEAESFIDEKSVKAKGKRLSSYGLKKINMLEPAPYEEEKDELEDEVKDKLEDKEKVEDKDKDKDKEKGEGKDEEKGKVEDVSDSSENVKTEEREEKSKPDEAGVETKKEEANPKPKAKPKLVAVEEDLPETAALPIIDEVPVIEKSAEDKPKKKSKPKKKAGDNKKDDDVVKGRLDDDQPLQIELDF
ncbi:MAG: DNA gyrase/topoisomerase IV subunit A [Bacteroidetes bacterium]|nr:MAG: DNA gyrase/topoisomerase IV subunit A [Bacteroidota bacterium]